MSLTYKSDTHIKSTFGGVATALARVLVLSYLLVQCAGVFDKKYSLQNSELRMDLTKDNTTY